MAADFRLLDAGAALPLKAQSVIQPIDYNKDQQIGYDMAGNQVDTQQKVQAWHDDQQTRQLLQQGMQSGAFDMHTPEGLQKAVQYLEQNGASPTAVKGLTDVANNARNSYANWQKSLAGMQAQEVELYNGAMEHAAAGIDALEQQYEKDKSTVGEQEALRRWNENRGRLVQLVSATPFGKASPDALQALTNATPDQAAHFKQVLEHRSSVVEDRLKVARAKLAEEQANAPKEWKLLSDGTNVYRYNAALDRSERQMADGSWVPAAIPGAAKLVSNPQKANAMGEVPELTPEENQTIAEYEQRTGKAPPVPAFGAGPAGLKARNAFLKAWVSQITKAGYTGEEAGDAATVRKVSEQALTNLAKQEATIDVGSRELKQLMPKILNEIEQLDKDPEASPILKGILNKSYTAVGNPKFQQLNTDMVALREVAARTLSGISGAGGTPVGFLHLSEDLMSGNASLAQAKEAASAIDKIIEFRRKGVEEEKKALLDASRLPPKKSSAAETSGEKERTAILQDELKKAMDRVNSAKAPEDKERAQQDVAAVRRELGQARDAGDKKSPKEGDKATSKSGKPIIYRNGRWEYE